MGGKHTHILGYPYSRKKEWSTNWQLQLHENQPACHHCLLLHHHCTALHCTVLCLTHSPCSCDSPLIVTRFQGACSTHTLALDTCKCVGGGHEGVCTTQGRE